MNDAASSACRQEHAHLLTLDDVRKDYGSENVLKNISFSLDKGGSLAVIGPSGCGKSTLLYLIAGLRKPSSGAIRISCGHSGTAFVLQDFGLFPWKTVQDNIALPLVLAGIPVKDARQRCAGLLEELGLSGLEHRWPSSLSGGQRQRVALGRALAKTPGLLLLDEPFSSLDAFTRESMQELILRLRERHGFSYVLVTHSVPEALYLGERILPLGFKTAQPVMENPCFGIRPGGGSSADYGRMSTALRASLSSSSAVTEGAG